VTSGNFSPVLGRGIALGFLPPETADGAAVTVDLRGTHTPAVVVRPPFHRLAAERPNARRLAPGEARGGQSPA